MALDNVSDARTAFRCAHLRELRQELREEAALPNRWHDARLDRTDPSSVVKR
jgi:hypothetical protein